MKSLVLLSIAIGLTVSSMAQQADAANAPVRKDTPSVTTTTVNGVSFAMVTVEGGTFMMGGKKETDQPVHKVTVNTFRIGKYEVTQKLWRAVMGNDPSLLDFKGCDDCPVENISWKDMQTCITRLNQITGKHYRLPTEAEWEFAARGGNRSKGYQFSGSDELDEVAWHGVDSGNCHGQPHPVGTLKPNELGIYDMTGNVLECCQDSYHNNYEGAPVDGSAWINEGPARVARGGSWMGVFTAYFRVSFRDYCDIENQCSCTGFRLAEDP